jgi:hypothetical protein
MSPRLVMKITSRPEVFHSAVFSRTPRLYTHAGSDVDLETEFKTPERHVTTFL